VFAIFAHSAVKTAELAETGAAKAIEVAQATEIVAMSEPGVWAAESEMRLFLHELLELFAVIFIPLAVAAIVYAVFSLRRIDWNTAA
jgi:hypothetical protein